MISGKILDLGSKKVIEWKNATIEQVARDIENLPGLRYGTDWQYPQLGENETPGIAMNMEFYCGRKAIAELSSTINFKLNRIILEARDAYSRLPSHLQVSIDDFLHSNPRRILASEKEVIDAYLNWEGIIGYTDTIVEIVLSAYGVQK